MWNAFRRIVSSEKYLAGLFLFTLTVMISIDWQLFQNMGNYRDMLRSAHENMFLLSVNGEEIVTGFLIGGPLITSIVCGGVFSEDLKQNNMPMQMVRGSLKKYHLGNTAAVFLASFLLLVIPLLLNAVVSMLCYTGGLALDNSNMIPEYALVELAKRHSMHSALELLFVTNPSLFAILNACFTGFVFALFAVMNYCISCMTSKDAVLCNTLTFGVYVLMNVVPMFFPESWNFSGSVLMACMDGAGGPGNLNVVYVTAQTACIAIVSIFMLMAGIRKWERGEL